MVDNQNTVYVTVRKCYAVMYTTWMSADLRISILDITFARAGYCH